MPTSLTIPVRVGSKLQECELVQFDEDSSPRPCAIELSLNGRKIKAAAEHYFAALLQLREELEKESTFLLVHGASRDVWPSGMAMEMGGGLVAYRMRMGKQALRSDLVKIFESGPEVQPCTVAEQRKFRDEWFNSLGVA